MTKEQKDNSIIIVFVIGFVVFTLSLLLVSEELTSRTVNMGYAKEFCKINGYDDWSPTITPDHDMDDLVTNNNTTYILCMREKQGSIENDFEIISEHKYIEYPYAKIWKG